VSCSGGETFLGEGKKPSKGAPVFIACPDLVENCGDGSKQNDDKFQYNNYYSYYYYCTLRLFYFLD
jgi:hypothetical protein